MATIDLRTVTKRSGKTVPYNSKKILTAIKAANKEVDKSEKMSEADIMSVTLQTDISLRKKKNINVEEIQDAVEEILMKNNFCQTAKNYILYRQKRAEQRAATTDLMKSYNDLLFADSADVDLKRDNANINGDASMGIMLKLGTEGAKTWALNYALPEKFAKAHKEKWIYEHDMDFSFICPNCCYIDLLPLFHGGFNTGHGFIREPQSIRSYASLACIAIQSNQNDMLGGQSVVGFDYAMAEGVRKTFKKLFEKAILDTADIMDMNYEHILDRYVDKVSYENLEYDEHDKRPLNEDEKRLIKTAFRHACRDTENETHQAMEAFIHNLNTMHSRSGAQVAFSSINFGTDTTNEGQLVIDKLLDAIWEGMGKGETPLFPISVMILKRGINYNPEDPNYYLFKKACKVSAKRLFPNFVWASAPYNEQYYKDGNYNTLPAAMGCRTKVMSNVNGPEETGGRGNFAFVTLNLPKYALEAIKKYKDKKFEIDSCTMNENIMKTFWQLLDKYINLAKEYLEYRYDIIAHKKVKNFPFLMGQHVYMGSDKLGPEDEIGPALKNASLSIGFCGLAECLIALIGKHHGESEEAQELGLNIVRHIRERTNELTKHTHMNWSTFSTPAENCAGVLQRANREKYGLIPGVTDRDYLTNSMHVPPYYPIKAIDKIRIEAPYHELCNAGVISYIEMDGDPLKNLEAFESTVRAMCEANMHYMAVNHPVDRDPVCGFTGIINNECPHCHRNESGHYHVKISSN